MTATQMTQMTQMTAVCAVDAIPLEGGVAALVDGQAVAVFRTHDGSVHALGNIDPFSQASVLSRGIVGSRGDVPTVASPMYKQVFDLRTGTCLDDSSVCLQVHEARLIDGAVEVRLNGRAHSIDDMDGAG